MELSTILKSSSLISFIFSFLIPNSCDAQRWRKTLDFSMPSAIKDAVRLDNGDIVNLINADSIYLVSIDPFGDVNWQKSIDTGYGLVLEQDGEDFLIGGTTDPNLDGKGMVIKTKSDGSSIWKSQYKEGYVSSISVNENGYFIGGNYDRIGASSNSILYSVDLLGNIEWENEYDIYSNSGITEIFNLQEDVLLVIDASTTGVGFEGTVVLKVKKTNGELLWRQDKSLGRFENFPDERIYLRPMHAAMRDPDEIFIAAPFEDGKGLIFSFSADGDLITEINTDPTMPMGLNLMDNGDFLITGMVEIENGLSNAVVERRKHNGVLIWQRSFGNGSFFTIENAEGFVNSAGGNVDYRIAESYMSPYIIQMTEDGRVFNSGIQLSLKETMDEFCEPDISDLPLQNIPIKIDNRFILTDIEGKVFVDVDTGTYEYQIDLPPYLHECVPSLPISVQDPNDVVLEEFRVRKEICPELSVGITYTDFIRGDTSRLFVQYNNYGSVLVSGATLEIKLDDRLELTGVSSVYDEIEEGIKITIPTIEPNTSGRVQLEFFIDGNLDLFSTICIEARISPRLTCNFESVLWNGPVLEANAECANDEVVLKITNTGTRMKETVPYQLYADGFAFEAGSIQLEEGEEKSFHISPTGSTFSILTNQVSEYPFNKYLAISEEGCVPIQGVSGTKGFVRMFDLGSSTPWVSQACIEVRDHYSSDRVLEFNRGLGRYHILNNANTKFEFSVLYRNKTGIPITDLELFIRPSEHFDVFSFIPIAASHSFSVESLGSGYFRVKGTDLDIAPNDEVHFRFKLDSELPFADHEFLKVEVTGLANDSIPFTVYNGFYNRSELYIINGVSPFPIINKGSVIGRGNCWEFHQDIQVLHDGTVLQVGSASEFGVESRCIVTANSPDDHLIWQKSYAFNEGGALIRRIIPSGSGRLLLIGSIDDNQIPDNYAADAYACMFMLNENGDELWRKVWKPGNGSYVGGTLNNGHFYNEDKIVLVGYRYTSEGQRQFLLETDINGEIHWVRDFVLGDHGETAINDIAMKVSSKGNIFIFTRQGGHIVKLDDEGNVVRKSTYLGYGEMQTIYANQFDFTNEEELLLIGYGYSYDEENNFSIFGAIVHLDEEFNELEEEKIFTEFYFIELDDIVFKNGIAFVSGNILMDSISNKDAIIGTYDFENKVDKLVRIADFGASDYGNGIVISNDDRIYSGVQTQTIDDFYNLQMGYFWTDGTITKSVDVEPRLKNINIYPSPAKNIITIDSPIEFKSVNAVAPNGTIIPLEKEGTLSFSVSNLPSGPYVLICYDEHNTRHISKFVKID